MRTINKGKPPDELTEWIKKNEKGPNCKYSSVDGDLREIIRKSLVAEQGGLCAYTGIKIDSESCHIEHLKPQAHCLPLEDVTYSNLVAAVPKPNTAKLPYGAHFKDNWPSPGEAALFVSPLSVGCSARFSFSISGKILARNQEDAPASVTIKRLGLDSGTLVKFRQAAIKGTIQPRGRMLNAKSAKRRLQGLKQNDLASRDLNEFSFALIDALEKHIIRLVNAREKRK